MDRVIQKEIEEVESMEEGWEKDRRMYVVTMDLLKYISVLERQGKI